MLRKQNELIKQLSDKQIVQQLYFTQILLLFISFILSFFLFDSYADFMDLWKISDYKFIFYGAVVAFIVILLDFIVTKFAPEKLYDDGGINEKLFAKRSVPHIFFLTAFIAFTEEFLFRGVLQTSFGLWTASIIFAIMHFRYVTKWLLFTVVLLTSFLLGIVYEWTDNLYTTIIAHFIIDLLFAIQIRLRFLRKGEDNDDEQTE
ncbi:type II CAAX endopeptidase family protein [Metabacillus fastidiosus]|uniref:CPBP family intramembrane glutamic endopeptidase n=1 Tax=Metabacillus fastidiosus TaxID=1458 RepID=UPI002DBF7B59|nr:type II CAAX endopeptidase family protein [Metabacillus fastidiosus]MEC2075710.1 type II CAAX endopeptidase family protein [Metabacillus fastidiosus]